MHHDGKAYADFNSRPCVRGDYLRLALVHLSILFQFTPLREGRQDEASADLEEPKNFNSRPCVRGDILYYNDMEQFGKFQFTPLREGRL